MGILVREIYPSLVGKCYVRHYPDIDATDIIRITRTVDTTIIYVMLSANKSAGLFAGGGHHQQDIEDVEQFAKWQRGLGQEVPRGTYDHLCKGFTEGILEYAGK